MPTPRIPDGQPMSTRTAYRRRAEAGLTRPVFRYPWNETFFDSWTPEMAWVVGLIWSDGNLTGNTIEICSKDHVLIEQVEGLIEQPGGMRLKNGGRHLRIAFTSRRAAKRLRAIGLTPAKSFTIAWPVGIPEEHTGAFVRGLLDGDGTMSVSDGRPGQQAADLRVELTTASGRLADGLATWLARHQIQHYRVARHGSVMKVGVAQHAALRRLHGLLYPHDNVPCLFRKRVNFDAWMATPRARPGRPSRTRTARRQVAS